MHQGQTAPDPDLRALPYVRRFFLSAPAASVWGMARRLRGAVSVSGGGSASTSAYIARRLPVIAARKCGSEITFRRGAFDNATPGQF
jgi:hypothetical protein